MKGMKKGSAPASPASGGKKGKDKPEAGRSPGKTTAQNITSPKSGKSQGTAKSPRAAQKSGGNGQDAKSAQPTPKEGKKGKGDEWKVKEFGTAKAMTPEEQAAEDERLRREIQAIFKKEGFQFNPAVAIAPSSSSSSSEAKGKKKKASNEEDEEEDEAEEEEGEGEENEGEVDEEEDEVEWDEELEWDEDVDWEEDDFDEDAVEGFSEDGEDKEDDGMDDDGSDEYDDDDADDFDAEAIDEDELQSESDEEKNESGASEKDDEDDEDDDAMETEQRKHEGDEDEMESEEEQETKAKPSTKRKPSQGKFSESFDALEGALDKMHGLLLKLEKGDGLRKAVGKLPMSQKETFLSQMAKLSLHTIKVFDKTLQLKQDLHSDLVDKLNLPKLPSELVPPVEDALDVLLQDLRKDSHTQGFVDNEEKWVQSGLWHRATKETQKAWTVYASATNQLGELDEASTATSKAKKGAKEEEEEEELTFNDIYMRRITEALADELDELKEQEKIDEDESRITLLVDCLQSGMDFYSDLEKSLCVEGWKRKNGQGGKPKKGLQQAQQELY